ncbi:MAG: DMT family transporter [Myxococcota bacterium]|nr:DMT family transporter [Myxococcota bacterium]
MRPGVRYMLLSAFAFAAMTACVRIVSERIPVAEIVFARALVSLVLSLALLRGTGVHWLGHERGWLLVRGLCGFAGLHCVFYAVSRLPLAEATVLQYLHPLFTALLAAVTLREAPGRGVLPGMALSLAGLVLVTRPGFATGGPPLDLFAAGVAVAGALFSACAYVVVRRLAAREDPLVIVLYFPLVTVPATLPLVLANPVWPEGLEWPLLLAIGALAQVGQVALTHGMRHETAARATALSYLQVVFAAGFGIVLFAEWPGLLVAVGAGLILAGATLAGRGPRAESAG